VPGSPCFVRASSLRSRLIAHAQPVLLWARIQRARDGRL
jgi:hypothetical protein